MILLERVREIEQSSKFDGHAGNKQMRRRAAMLYLIGLDGGADEWFGDVDTSYGYNERIGRHILNHDTMGFIGVTSYDTEEKAKYEFSCMESEYMNAMEDDDA